MLICLDLRHPAGPHASEFSVPHGMLRIGLFLSLNIVNMYFHPEIREKKKIKTLESDFKINTASSIMKYYFIDNNFSSNIIQTIL